MVDNSFYNNKGPFSLSELANIIGCDCLGDKNKLIYDLAVVEEAKSNEICFITEKYKNLYKSSKAGAFIISKGIISKDNKNKLVSDLVKASRG